jgi:Fe-S cluster assembly scaffold protein SufB
LTKSLKNLPELIPISKLSDEPDWFFELRLAAFHKLSSTFFPDSTLESWRKTKFSNFSIKNYLGSENTLKVKLHHTNKTIELVSIEDINEVQKKIIQSSLQGIIDSKENQFFQLVCIAYNQSFKFLSLEDSFNSSDPIIIESSFRDFSPACFQIFFLSTGKNSKATIYHKSISPVTESLNLFNSLFVSLINDGSTIEEVQVEEFTPSTIHIRKFIVVQNKDSYFKSGFFNLGGYRGKTFYDVYLHETGSYAKLFGVASPSKREIQDIEYSLFHNNSHTNSSIKFKTVMKDKSHHIFTGNLNIPKTSKHVEASQLNHNLILDKTARAESMPKLEVFAEDVKCSHGATMSEINEEQLFYLLSRGFTPSDARHLIVEGFITEIIDEFSLENSNELKDKLLRKLGE